MPLVFVQLEEDADQWKRGQWKTMEFFQEEDADRFVYLEKPRRAFRIMDSYESILEARSNLPTTLQTTVLVIHRVPASNHDAGEHDELRLVRALRGAGSVTKVYIDRTNQVGYVEISHFHGPRRKPKELLDKLREAHEARFRESLGDGEKGLKRESRSGWRKASERAANGNRATLFRNWLAEKYGKEFLCNGSGILDIAGGKGELAFKLLNYSGIPTTIVDPRPYNLFGMLKGLSKDHVVRLRGGLGPDLEQHKTIILPLPEHIRCWFTSPTTTERQFQSSVGTLSEYGSEKLCSTPQERRRLESHVQTCSLIIGMHPDQATEPIVDTGLSMSKPFAVVPCCIFPSMFPHRRDITKPDAFCKFLKAKSDKIQEARLNFNGRNQVLFTLPQAFNDSGSHTKHIPESWP